jgi:hypothetical protein
MRACCGVVRVADGAPLAARVHAQAAEAAGLRRMAAQYDRLAPGVPAMLPPPPPPPEHAPAPGPE